MVGEASIVIGPIARSDDCCADMRIVKIRANGTIRKTSVFRLGDTLGRD